MGDELGLGSAVPAETRLPEPPADSQKRLQILEGARKVFLEDGFAGASMNEIARVSGVSKGTLYVYFQSKEALFEALIWADKRHQAERMFDLAGTETDVRSALISIGTSLLTYLLRPESIALVRTVIASAGKFPQIGQTFYAAGPGFGIERLAAYLNQQVIKGSLVIDDTRLAASQFLELSNAGIFKARMFGIAVEAGREDIARNVSRAADMFLAVYARKPG